jgi:hypothetical protein
MELRTPQFGCSYWACPQPHTPPVVVQQPAQVDYALAFVAPVVVGDDFAPSDATTDGTDPADVVGRFCERMTVTRESARALEREHRAAVTGRDAAGEEGQTAIDEWSP